MFLPTGAIRFTGNRCCYYLVQPGNAGGEGNAERFMLWQRIFLSLRGF